jgi:chaperonin GroEL
MSKINLGGSELIKDLVSGVNKTADIVGKTLGPKGKNIILKNKGGKPIITKDGVTIAKFLSFENEYENVACEIIKEASAKTAEEAGDGTTTSTVLTRAIVNKAQKFIDTGVSSNDLFSGMNMALKDIAEHMRDHSKKIQTLDDVKHIAKISSNGDEMVSDLIKTAVDKVGFDGVINIEESKSVDTSLELVEGFSFDSGYAAGAFVTDERRKTVNYENGLVFITDHKLDRVDEMMPILELAARENKPLVIVAEEIEGQLLAALIMNTVRGNMKIVAIKAPFYGEQRRDFLDDLAIVTGGKFISRESGIAFTDFKLESFGRFTKIESKKFTTTVVSKTTKYDLLEARLEQLKELIKDEENLEECKRIQQRINRLASGVAILKVGGSTEIEMIERKHRVEDALEAVLSATRSGFHMGGGMAFVAAHKEVKRRKLDGDVLLGYNLIFDAILEPVQQIASNAGLKADVVVDKCLKLKDGKGFDMASGEVVDMYENGIIDPVMVTTSALRNAISVSFAILTTGHAVLEV